MILSLLIPSTPDRKDMLDKLVNDLNEQIFECKAEGKVEIIIEVTDKTIPTGTKRQRLLHLAKGKYLACIDDDDEVADNYILEILKATFEEPDVIGFYGFMTTNSERRENFKISKDLPYTTITDANGNKEYLRYNNHLSPIKSEIALQIGYPDKFYAEDFDYATRLKESGLIKTEVLIPKYLYHYKFISKK